jgi:hypothetical protein
MLSRAVKSAPPAEDSVPKWLFGTPPTGLSAAIFSSRSQTEMRINYTGITFSIFRTNLTFPPALLTKILDLHPVKLNPISELQGKSKNIL